jgi:hypothetical protein
MKLRQWSGREILKLFDGNKVMDPAVAVLSEA